MARSSGTRPKGSGIPAKGKGWGGPAKGASASRIKPGDPDGIQAMANDADIKARNAERNERLKDHLYTLATTAQNEHAQIAAAQAWLDRDEGKPISRSVTATVDDVSQLSDLELAAEIARLKRELGEDAPRAGEAAAGEQVSDVPPIH